MDAVAHAPRPAFRVRLSSWTCSFRYPNLISGFQPTLHVPPVSTVLGLLNAAAGRYLPHEHFWKRLNLTHNAQSRYSKSEL